MNNRIVVSKNGDGDFHSVQQAIDSIRVHPLEPVTIFLKNGVYEEKIIVPENKHSIKIIGENVHKTKIVYNEYARLTDNTGKEIGTFRTPVFTVLADDIILENITIQNTAGFGEDIGQALALSISGDRCSFHNVRLLGNQDTLYMARGRQLFKKCYIEGHVDYIFGSSTAIFQQCEIHSLRQGYITAASTPENQKYGFIFLDCRLTSDNKEENVYLGRPWRPHAHTVFVRTWMGPHIYSAGWDNWRNKDNEQTARYGEYKCTGPGAGSGKRVEWANYEINIQDLTIDKIFPDYKIWRR